jgi:hypothetical protein
MIQPALPSPAPVKKAKWMPEEDTLLSQAIKEHGMSNWTRVAQDLPGRNGKQCRERWMNQLCPSLSRDNWTQQEDAILLQQQRLSGNQWSQVAYFLPGRSANAVKNRFSWLNRHGISQVFQTAPVPTAPVPPAPPIGWLRPRIADVGAPSLPPVANPAEQSLLLDKEFDLFSVPDDEESGYFERTPHANTFDGSALSRFQEWGFVEL